MKKLLGLCLLTGLFSTALFALSFEKPVATPKPLTPQVTIGEAELAASSVASSLASPITGSAHLSASSAVLISDVLRAHLEAGAPESLTGFSADAVRLTLRPAGLDPALPGFFERHLSVVMDGNAYRRYLTDPLKQREWIDQFDGSAAYHARAANGQLVQALKPVSEAAAGGIAFSVKTFTLVPLLKQLADPATVAVYLGRTAFGHDKFDIQTATDRWTIYTDARHLICKVEARNRSIAYADYRLVDGVRLPFIQRLSRDGRLLQELIFTRIHLNPRLPTDYFSREAVTKDFSR